MMEDDVPIMGMRHYSHDDRIWYLFKCPTARTYLMRVTNSVKRFELKSEWSKNFLIFNQVLCHILLYKKEGVGGCVVSCFIRS